MKRCNHCQQTKPLEAFGVDRQTKDGLYAWCKLCASEKRKEWHRTKYTPEYGRKRNLRKYHITPEEFDLKLAAQGFKCAICQKSAENLKSYRGDQKFGVDHDHITGKNRGLLCQECNRALGLFHEDTLALQTAIEYLRHYKTL